jgi:hypothetical protein
MTQPEAARAVTVAEKVGFGGIGIYPDWSPFPGLHLDVRPAEGDVAKWAGVDDGDGQDYVAMGRGMERWRA